MPTIFAYKKEKEINKNLNQFKKILSEPEKSRIKKLLRKDDAENYILGRYLLRSILGKFLKITPDRIKIYINKYGKPYLKEKKFKGSFNLSHSGDWIIVAISEFGSVGVDIEKIKSIDLSIAQNFFCQPEIDYILKKPSEQLLRFYKIWTLKESYIKCLGKGLYFSLKEVCFKINKNCIAISEKKDYKFAFYDIASDYSLALCLFGDSSPIKIDFIRNLVYDK